MCVVKLTTPLEPFRRDSRHFVYYCCHSLRASITHSHAHMHIHLGPNHPLTHSNDVFQKHTLPAHLLQPQ